jgi:hypothetical protein
MSTIWQKKFNRGALGVAFGGGRGEPVYLEGRTL